MSAQCTLTPRSTFWIAASPMMSVLHIPYSVMTQEYLLLSNIITHEDASPVDCYTVSFSK